MLFSSTLLFLHLLKIACKKLNTEDVDIDFIKELMENGADVNAKGENGRTALMEGKTSKTWFSFLF